MNRKLKALAPILAAVCVLGAMGSSPAHANIREFTTVTGAVITGHDVGVVKTTITGQEIFCESVTYTGTAPAETFTTLTITPSYSNCKAKIFGSTINASITGYGAGGCDYLLHSDGITDLKCAAGKDVTVTAGTCVIHVPAQNDIGTVTYHTGVSLETGKQDLTMTTDLTEVTENHTDGFLCPLSGSGHTSTMAHHGVVTLTATVSQSPVNLTDHTAF